MTPNKTRVSAHRARQSQAGMVRVEVMIPVQFKDELREFAKQLNQRIADKQD